MSGILGIFNQDGRPVSRDDLRAMSCPLARRGPDGSGSWNLGSIGLGHTLLATTPEALAESMPLTSPVSRCVITADVRLDNRCELLDTLGLRKQATAVSDAGLILAAYLAWDTDCVQHLLGDFAFGIWDPRVSRLFCARDHLGMKPFYYHHSAGKILVFASELRAILGLPQTPYRINEIRIADYLIGHLEGADKTCTFFEGFYRLPPAHMITITPERMQLKRYWNLEAGTELRLSTDAAYAEAFLDVFTDAVACRLRTTHRVGSMLSGGIDSGSIVAVASKILTQEGRGPLQTFSATAPDSSPCVETDHIHQSLTMDGLYSSLVNYQQLEEYMPLLEELSWNLDDPFDYHMNLQRVVYLAAHRKGVNIVFDGVGGDIVLSAGSYVARLMRQWRWAAAYREILDKKIYWGESLPAWSVFGKNACIAFMPTMIWHLRRGLLRTWRAKREMEKWIDNTIISPSFAHQVSLADRLQSLNDYGSAGLLPSYGKERAEAVLHPFLTVGRERYDRVAASLAIEPRDPFMDLRVVSFCLRLPSEQRFSGGWSKLILRRAMKDHLPDMVRWRRGHEHLGWSFTTSFMDRNRDRVRAGMESNWELMKPYVNVTKLKSACVSYFDKNELTDADNVFRAAHLGRWLADNKAQPSMRR